MQLALYFARHLLGVPPSPARVQPYALVPPSRLHTGAVRVPTDQTAPGTHAVTIRLLRTLSSMVKAPLAPPGSALLVDLTGHKSTFAASELWAKSSAVIFVARRPG